MKTKAKIVLVWLLMLSVVLSGLTSCAEGLVEVSGTESGTHTHSHEATTPVVTPAASTHEEHDHTTENATVESTPEEIGDQTTALTPSETAPYTPPIGFETEDPFFSQNGESGALTPDDTDVVSPDVSEKPTESVTAPAFSNEEETLPDESSSPEPESPETMTPSEPESPETMTPSEPDSPVESLPEASENTAPIPTPPTMPAESSSPEPESPETMTPSEPESPVESLPEASENTAPIPTPPPTPPTMPVESSSPEPESPETMTPSEPESPVESLPEASENTAPIPTPPPTPPTMPAESSSPEPEETRPIATMPVATETMRPAETSDIVTPDPDFPTEPIDPSVCLHLPSVNFHSSWKSNDTCGTVLSYYTCPCGQEKVIDMYNIDDNCAWEVLDSDMERDEYGYYNYEITQQCVDCGLILVTTSTYTYDGCRITNTRGYEFGYDREGAVYTYIESYTEYHNFEDIEIDLKDFGCCGGIIYVSRCSQCGYVEYAEEYDIPEDCASDFSDVEEDVTENGTNTYFSFAKCDKCGLVMTHEAGMLQYDSCSIIISSSFTVQKGETEIVKYNVFNQTYHHNFVDTDIEFDGEDCDSGVNIIYTCTVCGIKNGSYKYGHTFEEERKYYKPGCCNDGYIEYYDCTICGAIEIYYADLRCENTYEDKGPVYDDNGNYIGDFTKEICIDCGIVRYVEYLRYTSGCTIIESYIDKFMMEGEEDFILDQSYRETYDHSFSETYEIHGDSCEDGVTIVHNCSKCGLRETEHIFYHKSTKAESISISTENSPSHCGSYIYADVCNYCGKISDVWSYGIDSCDLDITEEKIFDENGNEKGEIFVGVCKACGLKITSVHEIINSNQCVENGYNSITIIYDGEVFYDKTTNYSTTDHEIEFTYEMLGETCDDGYICIESCSKCGSSYETGTDFGHKFNWEDINLEEYGVACGGYISIGSCDICDKQIDVYEEIYCYIVPVYSHDSETKAFYCCECQTEFYYSLDYINEYGDCFYDSIVTLRIVGDEEGDIIEYSYELSYHEDHDIEYSYYLSGGSCDDGFRVVGICTKCDREFYNYFHYGHYFEEEVINFRTLDLCAGYVWLSRCQVCQFVEGCYLNEGCVWEEEESSEDGVERYVCSECGAIKELVYSEISLDYACGTAEICTYNYIKDGTVKASYSLVIDEIVNGYHDYECERTLVGESCEDGFIDVYTCIWCGYSYSVEGEGHSEVEWANIDLRSIGACDGYFEFEYCKDCYEITYVYSIWLGCRDSYKETSDDGKTIKVICDSCGFCYSETRDTTYIDSCHVTISNSIVLSKNDEVLYEFYESNTEDCHDIVKEYTACGTDCELDGYIYLSYCTKCDDCTSQDKYYGHVEQYKYEYFDQYGICYGYIEKELCIICDTVYYENYYETCYFVEIECDEEYTSLWECRYCGALKKVYDEITEKDENCNYSQIIIVSFIKDGETVASITKEDFYEAQHNLETNYYLLYDTCDDGYTIAVSCKDCDYSYNYTEYGHYYVTNRINFSDYGACGGYTTVEQCAVCEDIDSVGRVSITCPTTVANDTIYDDFQNAIGTIKTESCARCGLKWETKTVNEEGDGCAYYVTVTRTLSIGDTVLFSYETTTTSYKHEYDYTYNFKGDDCEDGYTVTRTCINCEETEDWDDWGHICEMVIVNFADYGMCGGYVNLEICNHCEEIVSHDSFIQCHFRMNENNDDYSIAACMRCGAERKIVYVGGEKDEECNHTVETIYTYTLGDTKVLEYSYEQEYYGDHDYESEYEMFGDGCEDGYKVINTCVDCGDYYDYYDYGHYADGVTTEFPSDFCRGSVTLQVCRICYETIDFYADYNCSFIERGKDDDGSVIFECYYCGLIRKETIISEDRDEWCNCDRIIKVEFIFDDEVFFEFEYLSYNYEDHVYEYRYRLGEEESCDYEYTVIETCKYCDYYSEWSDWGHRIEESYILYPEDSSCGGYVVIHTCSICGEICGNYIVENCDRYYVGIDDEGRELFKCDNCDLIIRHSLYNVERDEFCDCEKTYIAEGIVDGEVIFEYFFYENTYGEHEIKTKYEYYGVEHCDYGYYVIEYCEYCNLENKWESYGHYGEYSYYYFTTPGMCGGYLDIITCSICEEVYGVFYGEECFYTYLYTDEDGYDVYFCYECGSKKLERSEVIDKNESCTGVCYDHIIFMYNGEEILDLKVSGYGYELHDFEVERVLNGDSCWDGVTIIKKCADCGYYTEEEIYYHEYNVVKVIDLEAEGACKGAMFIFSLCDCAECGTYSIITNWCKTNESHSSFRREDGKWCSETVVTCEECGLVYDHCYLSYYDENGMYAEDEEIKLFFNGEIIFMAIYT